MAIVFAAPMASRPRAHLQARPLRAAARGEMDREAPPPRRGPSRPGQPRRAM